MSYMNKDQIFISVFVHLLLSYYLWSKGQNERAARQKARKLFRISKFWKHQNTAKQGTKETSWLIIEKPRNYNGDRVIVSMRAWNTLASVHKLTRCRYVLKLFNYRPENAGHIVN